MIALALFALVSLVLTGCEKKCMVPPGEYSMTVEPVSGDCPEPVLQTFQGYTDTVTVEPETTCSKFLTSVDGETEGGCAILMEISAQSKPTGLEDGQAVLTLSCERKEFTCKHQFDVVFEAPNNQPTE